MIWKLSHLLGHSHLCPATYTCMHALFQDKEVKQSKSNKKTKTNKQKKKTRKPHIIKKTNFWYAELNTFCVTDTFFNNIWQD